MNSELRTVYQISDYSWKGVPIIKLQLVKETEKSYLFRSPSSRAGAEVRDRREMKTASNRIFDTWEEARHELLRRKANLVDSRKKLLREAERDLAAIKAMEDPTRVEL